MAPFWAFDGRSVKAIAPLAGWNDAYYSSTMEASMGQNLAVVNGVTALTAYSLVPWLYQATNKKALQVSRMPFDLVREGSDTDLKDRPEFASLLKNWRANVFAFAVSKIVTGAGYWYLDANAAGRNVTLRFLRPMYVQPMATGEGVVGFRFSDSFAAAVPREIPLDRIVYSWALNLNSEVKPGPGEAAVVLGAASMLYALDAFAASFFNAGGVPAQVFSVPQAMSETDKQNFQTFITRAMNGVRNAFRTLVVRNGVEVTQVGSNIKDTLAPELAQQQRESVAAGLGFPPSAISGDHQNKATADIVALTTMTESIIPFVEGLYEDFNRQLFSRFGVEIVAHPERLEVMQDAQLAQAQAIVAIVGKPILTVDEGRERLGLDPLPASEEPVMPAPPPVAEQEQEAEAEQAEEPEEDDAEEPEDEADDAAEEDEADDEERRKQKMVAWRAAAVAAVKAGGKPLDAPWPKGAWARVIALDLALSHVRTRRAVERVFAKHWPGQVQAHPAPAADPNLAEAVKALQEFNRLASQAPAQPNIVVNLPAQSFAVNPEFAAPQIVVNVPEQPAPVVNVAAPSVTVEPADVTVNLPGPRAAQVVRDGLGRIEGIRAE